MSNDTPTMSAAIDRRPTAYWDCDDSGHRSITVIEQDPERRDTGILDQHGQPIWVVAVRNPIGFCR